MKTQVHGALAALAFLSMTTVNTAHADEAERGARTAGERSQMTWSTLDADGSGEVSRTEFEDAQIRLATQRFEALDTDGNKTLSAAEYAPAYAEATERRGRLPWFVRRRLPEPPTFKDIDKNSDRGVAVQEWLDAGEGRRAKMFERADSDGSGTISQDELDELQARMKRFLGSRN